MCMYDVEGTSLLRKFSLSKSKAMDGTIERLDSSRVTDAGPLDLLPDDDDDDDDDDDANDIPGARAHAAGSSNANNGKKKRKTIRCKHVAFAPTGQGWAASTTEGVMVFAKDAGAAFDPTDLGEDVTPAAARRALRHGDARVALLMALRLRGAEEDEALVREVLEKTPPDAVAGALRDFPPALLSPLIESIAARATRGPHAQLMLRWARELCVAHGRAIHAAAHGGMVGALVGAGGGGGGGGGSEQLLPALRRLSKAFAAMHEDLAATAEASVFLLDYVCAAPPPMQAGA